ncbi:MAG: response regulator transcription factor [Alphaproteobacteria bacterium]|nr:MAG: response regulator transcription factor [Alphaproteobacteria bacterium]
MPLATFLVEDNPVIRSNLTSALQDLLGAQVIGTAETEEDAVAWLASHKSNWTLAVVDLFLKQGNGLGVVRACRPHSPTQRVVVLTNYVTPDSRARCIAEGADAFFDKSTDLDAFLMYCEAADGLR